VNRLLCVALVTLSAFASGSYAQESTPPAQNIPAQKKPSNDVFSGSVTELTADSVTVVRKVPARDPVARKFVLDAQTKVEGHLHLKARVTVRYEAAEDGILHAQHIIVRP
jgi:hypothetical protein